MKSEWSRNFSAALILLLVSLPGFLTIQAVSAKNLPFLSITLSATTAPLGGTITVSGTLSGATPTASGSVNYNLFSGGSCSGALITTLSRTVTAGTFASRTFTMSAAGTFSFDAVYSGDANNFPATSLCSLPVTVIGTSTAIKTAPSVTTILVGGSLTDKITFASGTNIATATGTVTFELFTGSTCSGGAIQSQTLTITIPGNIFLTSNAFTISNAGTYSFKAIYSGDSLNAGSTSSCEGPITVNKRSPTIGTSLSATTITVGGTVSDAAVLTGASPTAGGTVTYKVFGNAVCAGATITTFTVTVTNGLVPNSKNFLFNNVGTGSVSFTAVYSGDRNNKAATSGCEGPVTISQATPSLITSLSTFSTTAGGSVTDTATLLGATSTASGTVTYSLFHGSAGTACLTTAFQTQTVIVTSGAVPSVSFTLSTAGSYSIQASYSGDANNASATSSCEGTITVT